jgi:hypothetical protein
VDSLIWKPFANDNAPATDGFLVGKNPAGFDIYVGQGTYGNDRAPGNIQPGGPTGFYMVSSRAVHNVTSGATYLVVPTTCECKWISETAALKATGMVTVLRGTGLIYWVGRHTFANGAVTVGKVYDYNGYVMGYQDNVSELDIRTFDALQCLVKERPCGEFSWI